MAGNGNARTGPRGVGPGGRFFPGLAALLLVGLVAAAPCLGLEAWEAELVNQVRLVHDPDMRRPATAPEGERDPTLVPIRVLRAWNELSPAAREEIGRFIHIEFRGSLAYLTYPSATVLDKSFSTDSFVVYYTDNPDSQHAVPLRDDSPRDGVPDFINRIAEAFEESRSVLTGEFGFDCPIPEARLYRVDVRNLPSNYYGYTTPTVCDTVADTCETYITMDNNYDFVSPSRLLPSIRVTAAHEFFHAVQFGSYRLWNAGGGYGQSGNDWIIEGTAVWAEKMVYPTIDEWIGEYLSHWFNCPQESLTTAYSSCNPLHIYGNAVFFHYLSEKIGGRDAVREIWETIRDQRLDALDAVVVYLDGRGVTLGEAFHGFAAANLTRDYLDGRQFPEMTPTMSFFAAPVENEGAVNRLASNYIELRLPRGHIHDITVDVQLGERLDASLLAQDTAGFWRRERIEVSPSGSGSVRLDGVGVRYPVVVLTVTNGHGSENGQPYAFSISVDMAAPGLLDFEADNNWILVSFPIIPVASSASDIFQMADPHIFWFSDGFYHTETHPDFPGFKVLGMGMWMHFDNEWLPFSRELEGIINEDPEVIVDVPRGWSIIGNPYNRDLDYSEQVGFRAPGGGPAMKSPAEIEAAGWADAALWGFENGEYYQVLPNGGVLPPLRGFWIYAFADLEMIFSRP